MALKLKKSTLQMLAILGGSLTILLLAIGLNRHLSRPRPAPLPAEVAAAAPPPADPRCSQLHYGAVLKSGAETYRAPVPDIEKLRQPLRGGVELRGPRAMKGKGETVETEHLRLRTSIAKLAATIDGSQGFRADHLVLSITNKSAVPVAYRVSTTLPNVGKCATKADLGHNAIALRPGETVQRTECIYHPKHKLTIMQVDVYEVTELGHRLLSRLQPTDGGPFDMRVARAHDRGELPACRAVPWRDLDAAADVWQAVIDFHARHDCDEYSQPPAYRPWTEPGTLPVCAP